MTSKKLSKTAQQSKDGDDTSDSLSSATANAILAAIEKQGNDLKQLIEDTKLSINTRLDALDAVLANVQSEQSGVKKRVEEIELAVTNCYSCLEEVEKVCEELCSDNKFLRAKMNDGGPISQA